jgi:hypothetical protein
LGLFAYGLFWSAARSGRRISRTYNGRVLGVLALTLVGAGLTYSVRRRRDPSRFKDGVARSDPGRRARLERLNEEIADLQFESARQGLGHAVMQRRAVELVSRAGFQEQLQVYIVIDEAGHPLLRLVPREHLGRLESWLMGHQYLGLLFLFVVGLHSGLQPRSLLTAVLALLALATVASGLLGALSYVLVPRLSLHPRTATPESDLSGGLPRLLLKGPVYVHVALAAGLLLAVIAHLAT